MLNIKKILSLSILLLIAGSGFSQDRSITGYVFVDSNNNGLFDKNEKPLKDVLISNGIDIVQTNKKGKYNLPLFDDATIFAIKPSGYLPLLSKDNISQAYSINKPNGSPEYIENGLPPSKLPKSLDFPFYPNNEEADFKIGLLGDTQTKLKDDVFYVGKLVGEQLIDEHFDFVVPLGDIVFDNLSLQEPVKQTLGKIGAVVYPVMGNHDRNYEANSLKFRDESFKKIFGPSYYAFNYGVNSFIVLNDIYPDTTGDSRKYVGKIDSNQLNFIKNYLNTLDNETPVYLFMHIPLEKLINLEELLALFKNHPNVTAFAGHTHTQYYLNLTKNEGWPHDQPLKELVAGAVCGSWWNGEKDMYGVPISPMADGSPKGYWVLNISGTSKPKLEFKVYGNMPNHQMHIWTPYNFEFEKGFSTQKLIIANIYAGSEDTKVEMKIEKGEWVPMQKVKKIDPYFQRITDLRKLNIPTEANIHPFGTKARKRSQHLWELPVPGDLEKGIYVVTVKASGPYGLNAESRALLHIE